MMMMMMMQTNACKNYHLTSDNYQPEKFNKMSVDGTCLVNLLSSERKTQ